MRDIRNRNWFWIENELIDRRDLSAMEKFLYMTLARFADGENKCFPSLELLSEIMGKDKRTIMRYIKKLIEKGLIEKQKRFNKSNIYFLKNVNEKKVENIIFDSDKNDSDTDVTLGVNSDMGVTSNSDKNVNLIIPNEQYIKEKNIKKEKKLNELENYIENLEKENEYKEILSEYVKYRRKIKKSIKTEKPLKKLVRNFPSLEELKEAVNIAMENEWQGLELNWVVNYKKSLNFKIEENNSKKIGDIETSEERQARIKREMEERRKLNEQTG